MSTLILAIGALTVLALVIAVGLCLAILRSWRIEDEPAHRQRDIQRELYDLATGGRP